MFSAEEAGKGILEHSQQLSTNSSHTISFWVFFYVILAKRVKSSVGILVVLCSSIKQRLVWLAGGEEAGKGILGPSHQ